ncbi:MAG: helix-turn-helix transcriptional regulator [Candidatus Paceibacterota bacterium]
MKRKKYLSKDCPCYPLGDICRALDMDRGYMSAIENGKKNITIQQLERLAQALEVSVDKLLK